MRTRRYHSESGRIVEVAEEVGFCFGVKRAISMTEEALGRERPVFIAGDLVHNRMVTERLEARGLRKVETLDAASDGIMVVRAHGLPREELRSLRERGLAVVDATCPIVHRAQEAAQLLEERGCQVVIIGNANHAEIKGIAGSLREPPLIIDTLDELRAAKASHRLRRKVGVVFQTTHSLELCKELVAELIFLCKEVQIINTICRPVQNRQDDAVELAEQVDLMLVVGSATSANTMELAALCRAHNPWTKHIESADDLRPEDLAWPARIGIVSGLSTPEQCVETVRDAILAVADSPDPSQRPDPSVYEADHSA